MRVGFNTSGNPLFGFTELYSSKVIDSTKKYLIYSVDLLAQNIPKYRCGRIIELAVYFMYSIGGRLWIRFMDKSGLGM